MILIEIGENFGGVVMRRRKKINWISWNKLRISKRDGGLRFRDLHEFNVVPIKQAWRLLKNPKTLWACFLKSIYFPGTDFHKSNPKKDSFWA